jgi:hypothetical protein
MVMSILMILSSLMETDDPFDGNSALGGPGLAANSGEYTAGRGTLHNRKVVIAA